MRTPCYPQVLRGGSLRARGAARARRRAWHRLFPAGHIPPLQELSADAQADARGAAALVLAAHREYLMEFQAVTAKAQEIFETRAWTQGALNAEHRVRLYRNAVNGTWSALRRRYAARLGNRHFWMAARQSFLESVLADYDADLALTFFYSTMRIAFDEEDAPVEYDDDGLADRSHVRIPAPVWRIYRAGPEDLCRSVASALRSCGFHMPFEDAARDASLVSER